ncbi:hypothetical protein GC163_13820 [bacterium]|nr:hypothetical protein [bacterium]
MARHEADREDLFAEARALVRRAEWLNVAGRPLTLVGWRSTGWLSIYLGPDLMYQFDAGGRLRRAYVAGELYRSQGDTLARLNRERTAAETTLVRYDLDTTQLSEFRQQMLNDLSQLLVNLTASNVAPERCEPVDDPAILDDLQRACQQISIADPWLAPAIAVRR